MILNDLAQELRTNIYVLMAFAPDDITGDMSGTEEIPADVVAKIRRAWVVSVPATERVQAGMSFLDEHYPDHANTVNLDNLDVNSGAWCPLAQAADDYYSPTVDGLEAKGIDLRAYDDDRMTLAQKLGFITLDGCFGTDCDDLDQAWIEAYEQRKAMINAG